MGVSGRCTEAAAALASIAVVLAACSTGGGERDEAGLDVEVVSSRPEYVSGGDALVAVSLAEGVAADEVVVDVDGVDVTEAFAADADVDADGESRLVGLVEGLPEGEAEIAVSAGDESASVEVTNHLATGPLFSG